MTMRRSNSPNENDQGFRKLGDGSTENLTILAESISPGGSFGPGRKSPRTRSPMSGTTSPIRADQRGIGARVGRCSSNSFAGVGAGGSGNSLSRLSRPSSREQVLNDFAHMAETSCRMQPSLLKKGKVGKALTKVEFQVSVETEFGDGVFVVGNTRELGFWDPHLAIPLNTAEMAYPLWFGWHEIPTGEPVEYKYVVKKANGHIIWETQIANRRFTPEGSATVLEDGKFNEERAQLLDKDFVSVRRGKHFTDTQVSIEKDDCIYVLSYRLPLITHVDPETGNFTFEWLSFASDTQQKDVGSATHKVNRSMSRHGMYVVESLRALRSKCKVWYVGGLGFEVPLKDQERVTEELEGLQCIPVFIAANLAREFEDFCHDTLKPVFHFVHPTSKEVCVSFNNAVEGSGVKSKTEGSKWQIYNAINLQYSKVIVQHFNDGDSVFVFDLELMMAPTLIGSRARTANICFFFNTPFPSAEIFRTLPVRKQILRSLLNADFIQFHCFTYARHFLACCSTLLGLEYRPSRGGVIHLLFNGHHCHVRASHVGIDTEVLGRRLQEPIVAKQQKGWRDMFAQLGRKVILVGYDDMEPLAGITLKLKAFRSLLVNFPEYRNNALLVQVSIPLHDSAGQLMHREYVNQVTQLQEDIDASFPGCLMMLHEKMSFAPRTALFSCADVLVNSAVRHGLSLVPFEYVLASESALGKKGSLLLSEFAACSRVIPGSMRFSPWKDEDVAKAIVKCLRQAPHEREHWHSQQTAWCRHNTVLRWAENIFDDMKRVRVTMEEMGEDVKRSTSCRVGLVKSTYKEISSNALKHEQVISAYAVTKTRLVILDVDLLIRPKDEEAENAKDAIRALDQLVEETGNYVFLLSNETRDNLLKWLRDMKNLEKVGLAAEDGYYYKWPGSPIDRWDIRKEVRADFKDISSVLMQQYAVRTTGTFVEDDKVASVTWHFGSTDPEFGAMQGKELLNHLKDTMAHLPVDVVMGKSFVRVRHEGVTKGSLVKHIVNHYKVRGGADFILCLADDRMDEDVFVVLRNYQHEVQYRVYQGTEQEVKVFLCTVGRQPSLAAYCLYSLDDVHALLRGLSVQTKRLRKGNAPQGVRGGSAWPRSPGGVRAAASMLELSAKGGMQQ